jgi:XisH protein
MPARDIYHDAMKNALLKDGWTITHDPYHLPWGGKDMFVDLGAEQFLAAEKTNQLIAVEIKSFLGPSLLDDLEKALGQFVLYRAVLSKREPERRVSGLSQGLLNGRSHEPAMFLLAKARGPFYRVA